VRGELYKTGGCEKGGNGVRRKKLSKNDHLPLKSGFNLRKEERVGDKKGETARRKRSRNEHTCKGRVVK